MYFPKSQLIQGLHTKGGELISFKDQQPYIGDYYQTSDGKYYTGKNPEDGTNILLRPLAPGAQTELSPARKNAKKIRSIPGSEPVGENMYMIDTNYYHSKGFKINRGSAPRPPINTFPKPLEEDYIQGEYLRYFLKKSNEFKFIEVSKKEYDLFKGKYPNVQSSLYIPIKIVWALTGDKTKVYNINKQIVSIEEKRTNVLGFSSYFKKKFNKYWRG
jgi:hypothetical protein